MAFVTDRERLGGVLRKPRETLGREVEQDQVKERERENTREIDRGDGHRSLICHPCSMGRCREEHPEVDSYGLRHHRKTGLLVELRLEQNS